MKCNKTLQSYLMVAVAAAAGTVIGTSAMTGYVMNGTQHHAGYRNPRLMHRGFRPSPRYEQQIGNTHRDIAVELREQERRLAGLRQAQEPVHAAAPEPREAPTFDARAHYRAYRWCVFNGYDHPRRIVSCVDEILDTGSYEGDS